jgi:hypothetical protein
MPLLKIFGNKKLRRLFGPKGEEPTGIWNKSHIYEVHNQCSSQNIIKMIKSRIMRWSGHVGLMGKKINA